MYEYPISFPGLAQCIQKGPDETSGTGEYGVLRFRAEAIGIFLNLFSFSLMHQEVLLEKEQ